MNISLSPLASEKLASRDSFGRPVRRQPATQAESGAYSRDSCRFPRRPRVHLFIETAILHQLVSPEFIESSRSCVTMAFTAESPTTQQGK